MHKLRRLLDDPARLSYGPSGYRLDVRPDELDATRFAELVGRGVAADSPLRRADLVRQALDLWRGSPFDGVDVPLLADEARRLGDGEAARDSWQCALAIYARLGVPQAAGVQAKLAPRPSVGLAHLGQGHRQFSARSLDRVPEGDTVYQTAHRLTEALAGQTVRRADLRHPRLATVDLAGRVFGGARSTGKHLFLRFGDVSLHCHLGMDGSWRLYDAGRRAPVNHRTRAIIATDTHTALGQSLVELKLVRTTDESRLVAHLGPDLLDPDWTPDHAAEALRRLTADPAREVGLALLDQRVMAGVGNVYKAEICFLLGVSPWTPVSDVDAERAVALSRKLLLHNAMRGIRNTTGDPRRGRELWVYGRERTGCLRCGGRVVKASQGDAPQERVAPYCPNCQP